MARGLNAMPVLPRRWGGGARRPPAPAVVVLPALLTCAVVLLPLVYVFVRSLETGWEGYAAVVFSASTARLLANTLGLAAGAVALSLLIAVPMAWLVTRTDLPGRRFWAVVAAVPLVFPSYVAAFSLVAVLGPRGYVRGWLEPLGVSALPEVAYGYSGALLALALFNYPYPYLLLVAALKALDPALEESSRGLGLGRWATFRRAVLPQLRPALLGGGLLVTLYTLSDFGAVSIVHYPTFTLSIYNAYRLLFDRAIAASLATVLVLLTLGFLALELLLSRGQRPARQRPARPPAPVPLGRWRLPAWLFLGVVTGLGVAMPVGLVSFWGARALVLGQALGSAWQAALNSLLVSSLAALCAVVFSVPVAAWAVRHPGPLSRLAERLAHAGYALPGLVIALSLVFFASRYGGFLYQSLALLVMAYVVRFLPEALAAVRGSLVAVAPVFEEAARSLGKGPLAVLAGLTLPMTRPGLLAGGGLVFLTAMKELPATLILQPIGFETLATRVWSGAAEGIYSRAAVPALWLALASALPVYFLIIRPVLSAR